MSTPKRSRVVTEPLGGSALSLAVQTRQLPGEIRPSSPTNVDEWRDHANRVRKAASSKWLEAIRPALAATGAAAQRLHHAAAERGIVVTTGQQAGFFGGPLYTLAKALTALALADTIEQQLGIPAAPVFWAATDDADFLEASIAHVADANGLHDLRLQTRPPPGTPMSLATLGDTRPQLEELRQACGSSAHPEYFELTEKAFTGERTLGGAYVHMLRGLLEPLGIAVLDSSHESYRDAARPILAEALSRAADVARATSERAAAIRQAGFEPQVEDDRGLSLVFALENGLKRRLSLTEASSVAHTSARADLLPNVLLRPVVERELLPTVGYVGGPGELAYFVQSDAVAQALGRERLVGVPRWSCTVIEPFAERALRRLGVEYHEVRDLHMLERRLATAALPERVASTWKRLQEQLHENVRALGAAVEKEALMPPPVIEGLERSLGHKLGRAERRLLAAAKRRDERVRRDLAVVSAALFPGGKRQERTLNYIPMLARGGEDLRDDMRRAAAAHAQSLLTSERPEPAAAR
jgi:bacillithiol biosynthesis cysteine-adding enzyme BshC